MTEDKGPGFALPKMLSRLLPELALRYQGTKESLLHEIAVNAQAVVDEGVSYDNWNGGTYGHDLRLFVHRDVFARIGRELPEIRKRLKADLDELTHCPNEFIQSLTVELDENTLGDWRQQSGVFVRRDVGTTLRKKVMATAPSAHESSGEGTLSRKVTEATRRDIVEDIDARPTKWRGRLSETEFLSRLYDLDNLPSLDSRFSSAREDIRQHRENNLDWTHDWVFTDSRFDLLCAPDETFLRFLCEMLHPVVRASRREVQELLEVFNRRLAADDWELAPRTEISGRPVFAARRRVVNVAPALNSVRPLAHALRAEYLTQQITRMESAVESDPELAVGTAKELLETVCKTILHECGHDAKPDADLPSLVRSVRDQLNLLPEHIPERAKGLETIRRLLGSLGTVAQGLAELRNLYGSGHGKNAKTKGLQPRHAKLAVGAASTLAVFFFETFQERKQTK